MRAPPVVSQVPPGRRSLRMAAEAIALARTAIAAASAPSRNVLLRVETIPSG